ncbi:MAG: argininosuccinate synthase [Persicimonas sp.]
MSKEVVLAFSGGLDTSFCVPWLREQGYEVVTLFVDTGGVDDDERRYIEERAHALGAAEHLVAEVGDEIWAEIVVPLIRGGRFYQDQYPLLCSDRYLIVRRALQVCRERGTRYFAHGCTGMGNDQVRFDLTVRALGDFEIVAPIREIQREHDNVRDYEKVYLEERGHSVRAKTSSYTINENLLGVTTSGSEIDRWEEPGPATYQMTAPPDEWPDEPLSVDIIFRDGEAVGLDGRTVEGPDILAELNERLGPYGVGRGLYTGDTTVGLKGRIVFEAPGLTALQRAHRALEEAVFTRHQNRFKRLVADKWVELVYEGFFYEPLKDDLEAFLKSSQRKVEGTVTLSTHGGTVEAVAVDSEHILRREEAVYAQSADWGVEEAEGFIKLFGQSSSLWAEVNDVDSP